MTPPDPAGAGGAARRRFYKMSGSGNDFIFFDCRAESAGDLSTPERVQALCARATGIGADGVVFLEPASPIDDADFAIRYLNSDGSLASLCGNASLCTARLAVLLGIADASGMRFQTGAGLISARLVDGEPQIDLQPVRELQADSGVPTIAPEGRCAYVVAGVPHLVVSVPDVEAVDVAGRGTALRWDSRLPEGANVNFVGPAVGAEERHAREIRTFERGVEAETLACGTGVVAAALALAGWGELSGDASLIGVTLRTRSGRVLRVDAVRAPDGSWLPRLSGEGRLVFEGELRDI